MAGQMFESTQAGVRLFAGGVEGALGVLLFVQGFKRVENIDDHHARGDDPFPLARREERVFAGEPEHREGRPKGGGHQAPVIKREGGEGVGDVNKDPKEPQEPREEHGGRRLCRQKERGREVKEDGTTVHQPDGENIAPRNVLVPVG